MRNASGHQCEVKMSGGEKKVNKKRTADGGWRTADGGRRTADGGRRTAENKNYK